MPETKEHVHRRKRLSSFTYRKNAFASWTRRSPSGCGKRRNVFAHPKRKSLFACRKRCVGIPKIEEPLDIAEMEERACVPEAGGCVCARDKDEFVYIPKPDEPACIPMVGEYASVPQPEECICVSETETASCPGIRGIDADFLRHMSQYIGMTVTVYTASGGESGCGVTGVLIVCADSYVRLLTQPASAPERPQGLCRTCPFYAVCSARKTQRPQGACLGAMVDIPVEHITIFVHSAVCGDTSRYNT